MKNTSEILSKILASALTVKVASEPETSHPTGKADPNNMAPVEGAHGKAITATVKADNPQGPENTTKPSNDGQGKPGAPINTTRSETDEDVPSTSTTQVDPGTSHPAEAGKTASLRQQTADLVAEIRSLVKSAAEAAKPADPAPEAPKTEETKTAEAAGAAAADEALVAAEKAKAAEDAEIVKVARALEAQAGRDAETLAAFIEGMNKQAAADEAGLAAGPVTEGAPPAGGMPPAEGAAPPEGAGGGMEQEIQQMIESLLAAGVTEEEIAAILQEGGPEALMQMFEQMQGAAAEAPAEAEKVAALTRATMVKSAQQKVARAVEAIKNSRGKR